MVTIGYTAVQGRLVVRYLAVAGEQHRLAQQLYDLARTAAPARPVTYTVLDAARVRLELIVLSLGSGDQEGGFPSLPEAIRQQIETVKREGDGVRNELDALLHTQGTTETALESARIIANTLPRLTERLDELVEVLVRNRGDRHQIHMAARQLMLAQRITTHLQGLLAGHLPRAGTMDQFGRDVALYGQVLEGLSQGGEGLDFEPVKDLEARARLGEAMALYQRVSEQANALLAATPTLLDIEKTLETLKTRSDRLLTHSSELSATLLTYDHSVHTLSAIALVFCALAGLALIWVGRRRASAQIDASDPA
jgi:twitching motility protein PilJ